MVTGSTSRHPFPSVLGDISRELLESQEALEKPQIYTNGLNTNHFPILDLSSVDVADDDRTDVETDLDAFPVLHDVHISHSVPTAPDQAAFAEEDVVTAESSHRLPKLEVIDYLHGKRPGHHQRRHSSDNEQRLPKLEVINFGQQHHSRLAHRRNGGHRAHQRRRGTNFRPIVHKVVMTRDELYGALKQMIEQEQINVEKQKELVQQIVEQDRKTSTTTITPL